MLDECLTIFRNAVVDLKENSNWLVEDQKGIFDRVSIHGAHTWVAIQEKDGKITVHGDEYTTHTDPKFAAKIAVDSIIWPGEVNPLA